MVRIHDCLHLIPGLHLIDIVVKYITLTVSSLCLAVALGSAIITGDLPGPAEELGMSEIVGNLAVTLFVVGFGVGVSTVVSPAVSVELKDSFEAAGLCAHV